MAGISHSTAVLEMRATGCRLLGDIGEIESLVSTLRVLSDRAARGIVEKTAARPLSSAELSAHIGVSAADVRHRMRRLRAAGVVRQLPGGYIRTNALPLKNLALYVKFIELFSSVVPCVEELPVNSDLVFEALSNSRRREAYELIIARPRKMEDINELFDGVRGIAHHHVNVLLEAGLIQKRGELLVPVVSYLPQMRIYFERLWLEAELGDAWFAQRQTFDPEVRMTRKSRIAANAHR